MHFSLARPLELKTGNIIYASVHEVTFGGRETFIYPEGESKDGKEIITFISICKDKNCPKCDRATSPHYVYLNTLERGHVKTLSVWSFKVVNS